MTYNITEIVEQMAIAEAEFNFAYHYAVMGDDEIHAKRRVLKPIVEKMSDEEEREFYEDYMNARYVRDEGSKAFSKRLRFLSDMFNERIKEIKAEEFSLLSPIGTAIVQGDEETKARIHARQAELHLQAMLIKEEIVKEYAPDVIEEGRSILEGK